MFGYESFSALLMKELTRKNPETTILVDTEGLSDNINFLVPRQTFRQEVGISEICRKVIGCVKVQKLRAEAIKAEVGEFKPYDFHNS